VDLGTLAPTCAAETSAQDINDLGAIVGYSQTAIGNRHAFLWTQAAGMVDLGTLGGATSIATGINNAGQVVGYSDTSTGGIRAFKWSAPGPMVNLGTVQVNGSSYALAINERGDVAGTSGSTFQHPVVWPAVGGLIDLAVLGDNEASVAYTINNVGQLAGISNQLNYPNQHAVLWSWPRQDLILDFGPTYGIWTAYQGGPSTTSVQKLWRPVIWMATASTISLSILGHLTASMRG